MNYLAGIISLMFALVLLQGCQQEIKQQDTNTLPILGQSDYDPVIKDSVHHQVQEFAFINQDSAIITLDHLKGKTTVVSFFFTSCPSICPLMTRQLKRLQKLTKDSLDIQILTHTVDPKRDSVIRLREYIKRNEIDNSNWDFVTGDQQDIFESGVYNYYLATAEDVLAEGGFLHSEMFVLVDKDLHLRGVYTGTVPKQVDKLIADIKRLENEYEEKL